MKRAGMSLGKRFILSAGGEKKAESPKKGKPGVFVSNKGGKTRNGGKVGVGDLEKVVE